MLAKGKGSHFKKGAQFIHVVLRSHCSSRAPFLFGCCSHQSALAVGSGLSSLSTSLLHVFCTWIPCGHASEVRSLSFLILCLVQYWYTSGAQKTSPWDTAVPPVPSLDWEEHEHKGSQQAQSWHPGNVPERKLVTQNKVKCRRGSLINT